MPILVSQPSSKLNKGDHVCRQQASQRNNQTKYQSLVARPLCQTDKTLNRFDKCAKQLVHHVFDF